MKARRSVTIVICSAVVLALATAVPAEAVNIRPLNDKILIKPTKPEDKPAGGIIIPDTAKEKAQEGIVIAVGGGRVLDSGMRAEVSVKVGDHILFGRYAGTELKLDGEEHLILREDDILAVIE